MSYVAGNVFALGFEVVSMKSWFLDALASHEQPDPRLPLANLTDQVF